MKKLFTLAVLSLAMSLQVQAIRPIPKAWEIKQSDGTTMMYYKNGDGYLAFYTSLDGTILMPNEAGDLCYAQIADGRLVASAYIAHEASQRTEAEKEFIAANDVESRLDELRPMEARHHKVNKAIVASTADGLGKFGTPGKGALNSIGNRKIPVIMVQFSDLKFKPTTTIEKMNRYYNEEGYHDETYCVGSARDYFVSQSRGMFTPDFTIVGMVTLSKSYKAYGANTAYGGDKDVDGMVVDAVKAAMAQGVDFSQFKDEKGNVELVSILYAGRGEATESSGGADYVWPCESDFDRDISGIHFNSFFVGNELYYDGSLMGMGIFCHELGHALGLPDFYCTNRSYSGDDSFSYWSIMDAGAYVNNARAPIGYTAYERSYMGWLDIKELTRAEQRTLGSPADKNSDFAVLIRKPDTQKEYFILENRQPDTWYPNTDSQGHHFGSGLMLTHITYEASAWINNVPNNEQYKKRAYVITADKKRMSYNASETNLFGNGKNDILELPLYSGDKQLTTPVYKITKNADGTITFNYISEDGKYVPYQVGDKETVDGITYQYNDNRTWKVAPKADGKYEGNLTVPETFTKDDILYTVVGVADSAFADCDGLTSVSLPVTATNVAANAFRGSKHIEKVAVADDNSAYASMNDALYTRDSAGGEPILSKEKENFNFNANPWKLPVSNSSNANAGHITAPVKMGAVTLTTTDGKSITRIWDTGTKKTFRCYQGSKVTLSVAQGSFITGVKLGMTSTPKFSVTDGTLDKKEWTGKTASITFTATGTNVIDSIVINYLSDEKIEAALLYYPAAKTGTYTVPVKITRIGDYAFEGTALSEIVLPDSLVKLGANALSSASLTRLVCNAKQPATATSDPFTETSGTDCKLFIPETLKAAYAADQYWKKFVNVADITLGVSELKQNRMETNVYYDLQGRRVLRPTRGIYIRNGKKVIIK